MQVKQRDKLKIHKLLRDFFFEAETFLKEHQLDLSRQQNCWLWLARRTNGWSFQAT